MTTSHWLAVAATAYFIAELLVYWQSNEDKTDG